MKNKKFNLNDVVRFKLTKHGVIHIAKLNTSDPVYMHYPLILPYDKDGYCEMQFWNFCNVFGSQMYNGAPLVVETEIEIKEIK